MAAGLGFKTFVSGEVLTAADTNGYLMQGILVFASASARNAAITSPQEGQYCYLKDTNSTEYYDGAAWVSGVEGDISGVTAGTGISGGGTSGTVTVTNSMATAITTKGDLVPGTGSGTFSRLAVGNNGETLVADSSASTGLRYQGNYAAGKNGIINGDCRVAQRGSSVTTTGTGYFYGAVDRFLGYSSAASTATVSQQAFTTGTAPASPYEAQFFVRSVSTNTATYLATRLEDVRVFAGQTVTLSFYAKTDVAQTMSAVTLEQNFGSGGSASVTTTTTLSPALTTGWQRFSVSVAVPSISGKTVGTSSYLQIQWQGALNKNLDFWGVQLEAGSVATAFQTATGTIQGELALCQRYFQVLGNLFGYAFSATQIQGSIASMPMRTTPTAALTTGTPTGESPINVTAITGATSTTAGSGDLNKYSSQFIRVNGFTGLTVNALSYVAGGQITLSAEL